MNPRSRTRAAVVGAVVASVAVCASAGGALGAVVPQKVTVGAKEYSFTLSKKKLRKGKVVFAIANKGTQVHDFEVVGLKPKSKFLAGGQKTTLTLTFRKAGTYKYICTLPGHAGKGMRGVIVVSGS